MCCSQLRQEKRIPFRFAVQVGKLQCFRRKYMESETKEWQLLNEFSPSWKRNGAEHKTNSVIWMKPSMQLGISAELAEWEMGAAEVERIHVDHAAECLRLRGPELPPRNAQDGQGQDERKPARQSACYPKLHATESRRLNGQDGRS